MSDHLVPELNGFLYGADYYPEQWPESTWVEDVALMRQAGVNLVTLGVFSWALLEPAPNNYQFEWLDRVIDLLHENEIKIDLATGTASPPAWFLVDHPEAALVDANGVRRSFGARQGYCPSSDAFRAAATGLAQQMAERYAHHPAVVMWHVSNEYACHNAHCYCDGSAAAFRSWLRERYGDLDTLNSSWYTVFWSQRYTSWEQILPPRAVSYDTVANPTQALDWSRFCSDEHLALFRAEATILRAYGPQPITTNWLGLFEPLDYWKWSEYVDLVGDDDYLIGADPAPRQHAAMSADLARSLGGGRPWLLMEHSPSAVNWQPRNLAKAPGQLRRDVLRYLSRGADGAMFFQWRASRGGAEKFHSAMVPHAGLQSKTWREVASLGAEIAGLAEIAGSRSEQATVAIMIDWSSWWAAEQAFHPSVDVSPMPQLRRWHAALFDRNIPVDFVRPGADLHTYRLVIVPTLYLVTDADAAALSRYVENGGSAVVTYFSGIVDEFDHVRLGGYPGAFREMLGVRIEEFAPLLPGQTVELSDRAGTARTWTEIGRSTGARVLARYCDGTAADSPALTVNDYGSGRAWYIGTELVDVDFNRFVDRLLDDSGVVPSFAGLPTGVEAARRRRGGDSWLFLINNTDRDVPVEAHGRDMTHCLDVDGAIVLPARDAVVVREAATD